MSTPTQYDPTRASAGQPAGIATASLVLGIVGFFVGVCSIIGLVCGLIARGKVKRGEIGPARVKAGIIVSVISLIWQIIAGIILVSLLVGGAALTSTTTGGALQTADPAQSAPVEAPADEPSTDAPAAEAPAADANEVADGDWTAADIQVGEQDFTESWAGTIRLSGPDASSVLVQFTVLQNGSVVGVLSGAVTDFSGTETVQLVSGDPFVDGDVTYELKVSSF